MKRRLVDLRNLGPASARRLAAVEIRNATDLEITGPVEAYARVRDYVPDQTSLTLLWALAGALRDLDWRDIPPTDKADLLDALSRRDNNPTR